MAKLVGIGAPNF